MNAPYLLSILLHTGAAAANIFLVAKTLDLPLGTVEKLVKKSPLFTFFFLFAFSLSVSDGYIPALLGTAIYFMLEFDDIAELLSGSTTQKSNEVKQVFRFRKAP